MVALGSAKDGGVYIFYTRPAKQLHVNGSVIVEGTLDIDLVTFEQSCPSCGQLTANCPAGFKVLSGGCDSTSFDHSLQRFGPTSASRSDWNCWYGGQMDVTIRLTCARLE